jgi:hypothetical protein
MTTARNPTILLSQRFSQDSQAIWQAALKAGWGVHRCLRFRLPDPRPEVLCAFGEMTFCDIMAERAGLGLLEPPNDWLPYLPEHFLKREVVLTDKWRVHRFDRRLFFKPANDKVFEKGIFERGADLHLRHIDNDCPILVSEVVSFEVEYRCHVLDGKILSAEFYRFVGERDEDATRTSAIAFAEEVLASEVDRLPSSVVLDVGIIEGRGWAVVEANQTYASGIYGDIDAHDLLPAVLRAAGPRSAVAKRDEQFLRTP